MLAEKSSPYQSRELYNDPVQSFSSYLVQRIDLYGCLRNTRECPLRALASTPQPPECTCIVRDIVFGLSFEFILEVFEQIVVKVLTAKVSITCGCLNGEHTASDVEERDIEGTTAEIENKHVLLLLGLLVETVSNSSGGGFVDDTEDVKTSNGTSIFGR
jgi:hypothetical protein